MYQCNLAAATVPLYLFLQFYNAPKLKFFCFTSSSSSSSYLPRPYFFTCLRASTRFGLELCCFGYSHKLPLLLETAAATVAKPALDGTMFARLKDKLHK